MMTTQRALTLTEAGAAVADRERLLDYIFRIEEQIACGAAETDWRELVKAARWIQQQQAEGEAPPC